MGDEVELIDDVELEGVSNDGADDVSVEDMDEDEGPVTSYQVNTVHTQAYAAWPYAHSASPTVHSSSPSAIPTQCRLQKV